MKYPLRCTLVWPVIVAALLVLASSAQLSFGAASSTLTVSPASGTYGGSGTLQATLTSGSNRIGNKQISFTLNGAAVGNAITNSQGVATLNNVSLTGIQANSYPRGVAAIFSGAKGIRGSQGTGTLTV